jgi:ubiquinone/menaquinone biosynthesis C-methylase UbiE
MKKARTFTELLPRPIGDSAAIDSHHARPNGDLALWSVILLSPMRTLSDTKTEKVVELISEFHLEPIRKLIVVGCGDGTEAAILAQKLNAEVVGVDLRGEFDPTAERFCELVRGDAMSLEFEAAEFDFVFSYHALEHIDDPAKALGEMRRVLKDNGGFWIGTPNKSRLVGYIGGKNTSFSEKIRWNWADWRMRLSGRFENRFGAHAGFTSPELQGLLSSVFRVVDDRTFEYFEKVYAGRRSLVRMIEKLGLSKRVFPSVYFSGVK